MIRPSSRQIVGAVAVTVVAFVLLGVVAGWAWSQLAHSPEYLIYRKDYAYYSSEGEFRHAFSVDLTFAWVGAVAALAGGLLVGWRYWSLSWIAVVLAIIVAAGAGLLAWQAGTHFGPPSVAESTSAGQRGDTFASPLRLGTRSMLFAWPLATLLGVIISVWLRAPREELPTGGWTVDSDIAEPSRHGDRQTT